MLPWKAVAARLGPGAREVVVAAGSDIARDLARRAGWIIRWSAAAAAIAVGLWLLLPKQWEAVTVLLPPQQRTDEFRYQAAGGGTLAGLRRMLRSFRLRDETHPVEIYHAVLEGEEMARRLVERLGLEEKWHTQGREDAVRRLSRCLTCEVVPYRGIEVRVRTRNPALSAEIANAAAELLDARLHELFRDEVSWERAFLEEALQANRKEVSRRARGLASYRAAAGLADSREQRQRAEQSARETALALLEARTERNVAAQRFGRGSARERDAARREEALAHAAESLPPIAARTLGERPWERELGSLESEAELLEALRTYTLESEAGSQLGVRVLDAAVPPEHPDRRPLLGALALALAGVPAGVLSRRLLERVRRELLAPPQVEAPERALLSRLAGAVQALARGGGIPRRLQGPTLALASAIAATLFAREPLALAGFLGVLYVALLPVSLRAGWFLLILALPWAWDYVHRRPVFAIQVPTEPGIILLVLAWGIALLLRGRVRLPRSSLLAGLVLTVVWIVVSSMSTVYLKYSLFQIVAITGFILAGALFPMLEIRRVEMVERVLLAYLVSASALAAYGLLEMFRSPLPFNRAAFFIGERFLSNHGPFSAFLGFAIGPAFVFLLTARGSPWRMGALFVAALLLTVATAVSLTRAAWVATIALSGVIAVARSRRFLRRLALPLAAAGGLVIAALLLSPGAQRSLRDFLERSVSPEYGSNVERLNRWTAGLRMVRARPLTGVGPSAFETAYPDYRGLGFLTRQSERRMGAHSELLRAAAEQGLPGLAILLFLVGTFYRTGWRLAHESRDPRVRRLAAALMAGVFTYTVHGQFNEYWRLPKIALTLWVFVGLLGVLECIERERRAREGEGKLWLRIEF